MSWSLTPSPRVWDTPRWSGFADSKRWIYHFYHFLLWVLTHSSQMSSKSSRTFSLREAQILDHLGVPYRVSHVPCFPHFGSVENLTENTRRNFDLQKNSWPALPAFPAATGVWPKIQLKSSHAYIPNWLFCQAFSYKQ